MLFLLVTLLCFVGLKLHAAEQCKTPDGKNGNCVSIYKCKEILDLLATLNTSQITYAQKSQCGYDQNPFVCCSTKQVDVKVDDDLFMKRYCGYQHVDDYYNNNGVHANIDEFPWLASLLYKTDDHTSVKCGGALINDRFVLTAAHCVLSRTEVLVAVRLGEYNIDLEKDCTYRSGMEECTDPTVEYGIEKTILHPAYSYRTKANDIALIKLNNTVTYSDFIRPICLPYPGIQLAEVGDRLVTSGWGLKSATGSNVSEKKKIYVELVSLEECKKTYSFRNITEKQTCTRTKSNSPYVSCQGDSGSPVMFAKKNQWHIESLVSFGSRCGTQIPDVNSNVVFYLNWIIDNIKT